MRSFTCRYSRIAGLSAIILSCAALAPAIDLVLDPIASGFSGPLYLTHSRDGSGRRFVVEQSGKIRIIDSGGTVLAGNFLNVGPTGLNKIRQDSEQGLLGLAFHPNYASNGKFYIRYSQIGSTGDGVVAQYTVSVNANIANTAETIILGPLNQPQFNHNGGWLEFGPDGLLYMTFGDGGGGGDMHGTIGNAQDLTSLHGKLLRIDVDNPQVPMNYGIPPDNFFASDGNPNTRGEIYAYGLRNPFRGSFDRGTGRLFIGDVGQDRREEVDLITNGANYGWRIMEGTECFNVANFGSPLGSCNETGLTLPIDDYPRSVGTTVTGGYIYRGTMFPNMVGLYIFADFGSGTVFSLRESPPGVWTRTALLDSGINISSFGEDEAGELYACGYFNGIIYHVTDVSPTPTPTPTPTPAPLGVMDFSVFE